MDQNKHVAIAHGHVPETFAVHVFRLKTFSWLVLSMKKAICANIIREIPPRSGMVSVGI